MTSPRRRLACVALWLGLLLGSSCPWPLVAQPGRTRIELETTGEVTVIAPDGARARFAPEFTVLHSPTNPNLETRWGRYRDKGLSSGDQGSIYHVLTWGKPAAAARATGHVADGYDPSADRFYGPDRSPDFLAAGTRLTLRAGSFRQTGDRIVWSFPENQGITLEATVEIPSDGGEARLEMKASVAREGWYSFGYTGAPSFAVAAVEELWQPLIYTERRFPEGPFLEASGRCPLPTTLVTSGGLTLGVMADVSEIPYQPMPTLANSRFGVALRNSRGEAQPMLFAPILGGSGSRLAAGGTFGFVHRLLVTRRSIDQAQEHLARTHFGFSDRRHNALGSLNATFERMLQFGLSEYARFNADLRGFAYDTDVPGSVKNVSALHPLSLAIVTDNREIFDRLARPLAEFFVSRERFLFTIDPTVKGQSASSRLGGLGASLSDFAAMHQLSGGRTPFFLEAAQSLFGRDRSLNLDSMLKGDFWANSLALYRASGDRTWLERARRDADAYLKQRVLTPQTHFEDPYSRGMFFWTSFSSQWIELLELYEQTGDRRYLEAARAGARNYTRYIWYSPRVPEGNVTVNQGGFAPSYRAGPKFPRVALPEETVPAWLVSEMGLTPESSGTSRGHRGVLLTNFAPWMLRVAALTGDRFLHDTARSAIIGRYTSFPGYHLNTARTTAYQKPNFAERPKAELNAMTSIHFNHIWPHIALVLDFLVSDAVAKSGGKVSFPSQYAEGYGYLQQKVYGSGTGRVYDVDGLHLWMPRQVAQVEHPELNYIVARGNNRVALVFTNQSKAQVSSLVRLNPAIVGLPTSGKGATLTVWKDGERLPAGGSLTPDGGFAVDVAPEGVTAVVVQGVAPRVGFQRQALDPATPRLPPGSVHDLAFRGGRAVAMRFGAGDLTSVYLYLPDFDREIVSCRLLTRQGDGAWQTRDDASFPFDFTVPVSDDRPLDYRFELTLKSGSSESSPQGRVLLK